MNLQNQLTFISKALYKTYINLRRYLPKQRCEAFEFASVTGEPRIGKIHIINLDRQPERWSEIKKELGHILDFSNRTLDELAERFSAVDARNFVQFPIDNEKIHSTYTLRDQLYVEPQPEAMPSKLELDKPISMSRPEVAVACSHIEVWKKVAQGCQQFALILEDDIIFHSDFAAQLDRAWAELFSQKHPKIFPDIIYVSYEEVRGGAHKTFLSEHIFRPERGLWHLSGYILSREGAIKLLQRLPCRGPVDMWINQQFQSMNVVATRRSIISQRRDGVSTNSYSILPSLGKIGVIDAEKASLFQIRPLEQPVFAFGEEQSGLSSLSMALSMLGYCSCCDLEFLPNKEQEHLFSNPSNRAFNAYVNIGSLEGRYDELERLYPKAKFIFTVQDSNMNEDCVSDFETDQKLSDILVLPANSPNKWKLLCEHLRCAPPLCAYPNIEDQGQRQIIEPEATNCIHVIDEKILKHDNSPWVLDRGSSVQGITCAPVAHHNIAPRVPLKLNGNFRSVKSDNWFLRDDTFIGNLAMFNPSNIIFQSDNSANFIVRKENARVREFTAAALSSRRQFLYGKFETTLQASSSPGIVTGFFLHRDSPRQEIDIEIAGNRPNCILVNVFYNPGDDGSMFDYGYRGTPRQIKLDFDLSKSHHKLSIEWYPNEIRWLIDDQLIHRRGNWDPTPIPHLPMHLHVNSWPSRSRELAGRLNLRKLPSSMNVKSMSVRSNHVSS